MATTKHMNAQPGMLTETEQVTVTLRNDFHSRTVQVRLRAGDYATPRQMARARRALCGMPTCDCGSIRGRQEVSIQEMPDGGARFAAACGGCGIELSERPHDHARCSVCSMPVMARVRDGRAS